MVSELSGNRIAIVHLSPVISTNSNRRLESITCSPARSAQLTRRFDYQPQAVRVSAGKSLATVYDEPLPRLGVGGCCLAKSSGGRGLEPHMQASACTDRDTTDLFWVYQINGDTPMPLSLGTLGSTECGPRHMMARIRTSLKDLSHSRRVSRPLRPGKVPVLRVLRFSVA